MSGTLKARGELEVTHRADFEVRWPDECPLLVFPLVVEWGGWEAHALGGAEGPGEVVGRSVVELSVARLKSRRADP